jgi:hypothetical protein
VEDDWSARRCARASGAVSRYWETAAPTERRASADGVVASMCRRRSSLAPQAVHSEKAHNAMSVDLKFQLRLTLSEEFAQVARNDAGHRSISPLTDILNRHDAVMTCQFDAFAGYVSEAEAKGIENYPLYEWTKKTIDFDLNGEANRVGN